MGCGAAKPIIKRCMQNQSEENIQSLRTASRLFYKAKVAIEMISELSMRYLKVKKCRQSFY